MSDIEDVPAPKPRGRPRKAVAEVVEEAPPPKRGRPRKVVEEPKAAPPPPPPPPPEPAKRGRPRKVVEEVEEPPPPPPPEPPRRAKKQREARIRDPSELEPKQVSFSSARGERSFAARAPKRSARPETPQPEPEVQEAAPLGPFHALHHRPISARQAAMETLMAGWR